MRPKILSKKTVCKGSWVKIVKAKVELPDKQIVEWDYVDGLGAVAAVAIDDKNNIYLSKEWRPAWDDYLVQLPSGGCKSETEDGRIEQARDELKEEIGFDARRLEKLIGPIPIGSRERSHYTIYLATGLFESKKAGDRGEIIEIVKLPFDKAYRLLKSGKVKTTIHTLLGMGLAKERLKL